ncbi:hypothetical protein GGX14DRAFT_400367 [Mycena pura]|uniref:Uncharacterized protein n=1 Tax=Mycena pura TaxID=153505 RepID=A0AAD6V2R5_9AGAR|nr:hypothetical protein GGX14DRAFT_400367 [Mycena pura]
MSRGSCGHCPSGDLSMVPHPVTVAIQSRCMLLRRLSSLCLHAAGAYKRDAWAFTQLPFLKVPQDALSVGALDVPGHIYLIKTRQTLQFSLRAFLKVLALVPYQQSRAPAAQVWSQAQSTGGTADQRRRNTAIHNRPFGPATGASMPRGPHRAFATNGRLGTSSLASIKTVQRELTFVLWPFPMPNQRYTDVQYPDLYPIDPRLFGSEDATFFSILRQFRLLLTFKVSLAPDGTEDKELIFYAELNTSIAEHMAEHGLHFSGQNPLTSVTPIMPAGADSTTLNEWHAMRLLGFAWTTLMLGNKPKPGYRRKLSAASIPWYDFKIAALSTKQWSTLNDTVNPGAPKFGPLKGPLPGGSKTDIHMCFALHFQHALGEFGTDDPIACLDICPPGASFTATPSASSGSRVPSMESATGGSRVPLFDSAATDSDQEEEQVRQAIALSMIQVSSSSSTTGDGPSRRPLPQRPTTNIRPRSQTISPPPSIRRRLNPTSIELRRSPSLVLVEAALPMYRTIRAWYLALDAKLSTIPFAITAPTTEAAVNALLQHIESFFGGEPYEADSGVDSVVIEPLGEYGPLTVDRSWKCFSNGSIGPGVGSNILTELINTVFSDPTAWKKTVRDTHVINITPAGIQPNHNRLRRLKAYGYACRLYVVLEHALPPPISVFLAYALLAPKGEYDVILDETLVRMYAPDQWQMLQKFPSNASEFMEKKDDAILRELTIEYFNQMPETLALLSDDMFVNYKVNFFRQVLFGCQIPFSESPEILAFREGFNGCINDDSALTLGQSFGASLMSLTLKMAAGRIKTPQDVIDRLDWISSDKPEFEAAESLYKMAFIRYLNGRGRVRHTRLPLESLTESERDISDDDPLARTLMFLMFATGTQLLPPNNSAIEMTFIEKYNERVVDHGRGDPQQNPLTWPDVRPIGDFKCKLFEEHVNEDLPVCEVRHDSLGSGDEAGTVGSAAGIMHLWRQHAACVLFRWFHTNLKMGFSR